ncbi:MAG: adenosylcobinamide-GDP ribazoletransferase [Acidimicrobiia bacterium]
MRKALAFLTPLPTGTDDPTPDRSTLTWFPLAGALLGLLLGVVWWGADRLWPPAVAAALVVVADLGLTGMLHLDGLADTADGLLGPLPSAQRRLEVMATPDVGAFGTGAVAATLVLRFAALASMGPSALLLSGLWCASRTVMAVVARAVPYARPGGVATEFAGGDWRPVALYGVVAATALAGAGAGAGAAVAVTAAFAAGLLVAAGARRRIGGFTGDVLGAAGVVAESVGLLVAAAKW